MPKHDLQENLVRFAKPPRMVRVIGACGVLLPAIGIIGAIYCHYSDHDQFAMHALAVSGVTCVIFICAARIAQGLAPYYMLKHRHVAIRDFAERAGFTFEATTPSGWLKTYKALPILRNPKRVEVHNVLSGIKHDTRFIFADLIRRPVERPGYKSEWGDGNPYDAGLTYESVVLIPDATFGIRDCQLYPNRPGRGGAWRSSEPFPKSTKIELVSPESDTRFTLVLNSVDEFFSKNSSPVYELALDVPGLCMQCAAGHLIVGMDPQSLWPLNPDIRWIAVKSIDSLVEMSLQVAAAMHEGRLFR
ncbi:MAG: hypothetical protein O2856_12695 [Planctomycetota bacterium]|nr:hypothetical protein [Planctomycetota bacterium]